MIDQALAGSENLGFPNGVLLSLEGFPDAFAAGSELTAGQALAAARAVID